MKTNQREDKDKGSGKMIEFNSNYVSISRAAMLIDVSTVTIKRWYKWWENDQFEKPKDLFLPSYCHKDRRGTKFFRKEDIPALKEFRNKIQTVHKGCMAEFNAVLQWGKRGKKVLENKGTNYSEIRGKMR